MKERIEAGEQQALRDQLDALKAELRLTGWSDEELDRMLPSRAAIAKNIERATALCRHSQSRTLFEGLQGSFQTRWSTFLSDIQTVFKAGGSIVVPFFFASWITVLYSYRSAVLLQADLSLSEPRSIVAFATMRWWWMTATTFVLSLIAFCCTRQRLEAFAKRITHIRKELSQELGFKKHAVQILAITIAAFCLTGPTVEPMLGEISEAFSHTIHIVYYLVLTTMVASVVAWSVRLFVTNLKPDSTIAGSWSSWSWATVLFAANSIIYYNWSLALINASPRASPASTHWQVEVVHDLRFDSLVDFLVAVILLLGWFRWIDLVKNGYEPACTRGSSWVMGFLFFMAMVWVGVLMLDEMWVLQMPIHGLHSNILYPNGWQQDFVRTWMRFREAWTAFVWLIAIVATGRTVVRLRYAHRIP